MKCNNCGTDNDEKSEVCSGCGQPLKGEDPPKAPDANGANKDGANGKVVVISFNGEKLFGQIAFWASCAAALFSVFFMFFIGCNASADVLGMTAASDTYTIYSYFYDLYKTAAATYSGTAAFYMRFGVSFGTIVCVCIIASVIAFAAISAINIVKKKGLKAIMVSSAATYVSYILSVALFMMFSTQKIVLEGNIGGLVPLNVTGVTKLNGMTVAGIVLSTLAFAAALAGYVLKNPSKLKDIGVFHISGLVFVVFVIIAAALMSGGMGGVVETQDASSSSMTTTITNGVLTFFVLMATVLSTYDASTDEELKSSLNAMCAQSTVAAAFLTLAVIAFCVLAVVVIMKLMKSDGKKGRVYTGVFAMAAGAMLIVAGITAIIMNASYVGWMNEWTMSGGTEMSAQQGVGIGLIILGVLMLAAVPAGMFFSIKRTQKTVNRAIASESTAESTSESTAESAAESTSTESAAESAADNTTEKS